MTTNHTLGINTKKHSNDNVVISEWFQDLAVSAIVLVSHLVSSLLDLYCRGHLIKKLIMKFFVINSDSLVDDDWPELDAGVRPNFCNFRTTSGGGGLSPGVCKMATSEDN